jgi:type II secretory pathway predicted ATPase ExeA
MLGLNLPSQPTFALILIGDEYLLGQLQLRNHRVLCSRLTAHHRLSPWTFEEIQTYLKTGLEAVGINRSKVFEPAAVDLLARAAWLEAARADPREISPPKSHPLPPAEDS